jgi:hypothetical protein
MEWNGIEPNDIDEALNEVGEWPLINAARFRARE